MTRYITRRLLLSGEPLEFGYPILRRAGVVGLMRRPAFADPVADEPSDQQPSPSGLSSAEWQHRRLLRA